MEKAIFLHSMQDQEFVTDEYSRLYFGIEFCERLIPSAEETAKAFDFARGKNLDFTLVTPFVTDEGLKRLERLVDFIINQTVPIEIVINDWGFFHYLKKKGWNGQLALGRLLTKQKRGPRILNIQDKLPKKAVEHFKQCNIDVPILAEFLLDNGIKRVELDNLLQGISRPKPLIAGSLYFPYAYITVTRYCLAAFSNRKSDNLRYIADCNKECRNNTFELEHKSMPTKIFLKGNTQFFYNDSLPENLETLNIDRLVFEPKIPL